MGEVDRQMHVFEDKRNAKSRIELRQKTCVDLTNSQSTLQFSTLQKSQNIPRLGEK